MKFARLSQIESGVARDPHPHASGTGRCDESLSHRPTCLTAGRLREVLDYDPEVGAFIWRVRPAHNIKVGSIAGTTEVHHDKPTRYRRIRVDGTRHFAHRLAWLYIHGEWPSAQIDHINCDGMDNRIANLRLATNAQNRCNARKRRDNTSGFKGVSWRKYNRWHAEIYVRGCCIHLGLFDTAEEAGAAYVAAAKIHFGEFARAA